MFPILTVLKGKDRALINRHPWIFSGAVKRLPKAQDGDIVQIHDHEEKLLGYGFFAPENQIVCRVFEFTNQETAVDTYEYWLAKIQRAKDLRTKVIDSNTTNTYRLINAEGDFFSGLIADVYDKIIVMQLLVRGTEKIKAWIIEAFLALGYEAIYLKTKEVSQKIEQVQTSAMWLAGEAQERILVRENNILFYVEPMKGQKTGFFLDQRDSRALVGQYSKGKNVLNTFSYTGGFSLYALQNEANLVHSVDVSKSAIDLCHENVHLNSFEESRHTGFSEDCFDFLRHNRETEYDLIVLDPPAFAKNAASVPNACRGYKDLNLLAFKRIRSGGIIFTFSCSQRIDRDLFRKVVFGAAADARRNIRILHQTTQPADHPINIYHPENEYLKGLVLYVE